MSDDGGVDVHQLVFAQLKVVLVIVEVVTFELRIFNTFAKKDPGEVVGEEGLQFASFLWVDRLIEVAADVELQQSVGGGGPMLFGICRAGQEAVQGGNDTRPAPGGGS